MLTSMKGNLAQDTSAHAPISVIVFDIGGTWFRSGIVTSSGQLLAITRREAINYKNTLGMTVSSLQEALVDYLVKEAHQLRVAFPQEDLRLAGISMGAALNAHTGLILNSGPLWGPDCLPFDLLVALHKHEHRIQWTIVNDITAALLQYVCGHESHGLSKLMLVTVSTGIGCRTYDVNSHTLPVDRIHGLQGEIGHIPISFGYKGHPIELQCDCGSLNHLNAFCSGRGIEALLRILATSYQEDFQTSLLSKSVQGVPKHLRFSHFAEAVARNDAFATSILDAVTLPLARILINLFTLDPTVEQIILTGGVVQTLRARYLNSLLGHLDTIGLYQISSLDPSFFHRRIRTGVLDDNSGLLGAAISAKLQAASFLLSPKDKAHQWPVQAQLPIYYKIVESPGLFTPENRDILFNGHTQGRHPLRRFVIIDERVDKLYGDRIRSYFRHYEVESHFLAFHASEQDKSMDRVLQIMEELDAFIVTRHSEPIIAIGGGVLLDIAGLAASLYRRGIPYIRVPTTLISLVDAGVGVKTAVNFQGHKNRIGTYYPPLAAFLDRTFLCTLDDRHIRNGLAEILKIAIVKNRELFGLLESHGAPLIAEKLQGMDASILVIHHAIQGMLEELEPNLWEHKLDRLMDFGHTFSPAIEMRALPELLHGEAVAMDIALSTMLAHRRGLLSSVELHRVLSVMRALSLPIISPTCEVPLLYEALQEAVRHRNGFQRLVLPTTIGSARFCNDITFEEIEAAVHILKQLG